MKNGVIIRWLLTASLLVLVWNGNKIALYVAITLYVISHEILAATINKMLQ